MQRDMAVWRDLSTEQGQLRTERAQCWEGRGQRERETGRKRKCFYSIGAGAGSAGWWGLVGKTVGRGQGDRATVVGGQGFQGKNWAWN